MIRKGLCVREISEITWKSFAPAYGQAHPVVQKGMDHYLPPAGAALWGHARMCRGGIPHSCLGPIPCISHGLKKSQTNKKVFFFVFSYEEEKSMVHLGSHSVNFFVISPGNVSSIPVPPLTYI